jgi:hypothetical protein
VYVDVLLCRHPLWVSATNMQPMQPICNKYATNMQPICTQYPLNMQPMRNQCNQYATNTRNQYVQSIRAINMQLICSQLLCQLCDAISFPCMCCVRDVHVLCACQDGPDSNQTMEVRTPYANRSYTHTHTHTHTHIHTYNTYRHRQTETQTDTHTTKNKST